MNLTEARSRVAAAVSKVVVEPDGRDPFTLKCTPRPVQNNIRVGDSWVVFGTSTPGPTLGSRDVTLEALVSLGSDRELADLLVDYVEAPLLACLDDDPELYGRDITVSPQQMVAAGSGGGRVYVLTLSVVLELSA